MGFLSALKVTCFFAIEAHAKRVNMGIYISIVALFPPEFTTLA
jgi:hypothetical protein